MKMNCYVITVKLFKNLTDSYIRIKVVNINIVINVHFFFKLSFFFNNNNKLGIC